MTRLLLVSVVSLAAAACGGRPPASPTPTPPRPTLPTPGPTATPATTPTEAGNGSTLTGGTGSVTIAGESYQLLTGDSPICLLNVGVQIGMASADRQVSLTVHALDDLNATNFALITPDDRWVPAEGSARFEVAGSRATWSGTLVGQHTERQEQGSVEIECGG